VLKANENILNFKKHIIEKDGYSYKISENKEGKKTLILSIEGVDSSFLIRKTKDITTLEISVTNFK